VPNPPDGKAPAVVTFGWLINSRWQNITTLRLELVNEGGWKLNDIIDPHSKRYTDALQYNIVHNGRE
jgi:hypothetical protein